MPPAAPKARRPCIGVSAKDQPLIPQYLKRSGAGGGGARSREVIMQELFPKQSAYKNLSVAKKKEVDAEQKHECAWVNDHAQDRIFSTKCEKKIPPGGVVHPTLVLNFKKALNHPVPDLPNFKYNNKNYQGRSLAELFGKCHVLQDIIECKAINLATTTSLYVALIGAITGYKNTSS
ncbi:hypothetical protein B0H13DRAFT_1906714 [Mycena leptocephala]|nr:hypothetical protein B0H13DRAFT_1906714 [Mycena leptocephala]